MPCAPAITAVLMPTTSPRVETSGPPELPGLRAASVCNTSSISRPLEARSDRPSADTTPEVTVNSKPSGLPMATTNWPRRSCFESPSTADASRRAEVTRRSARSVSRSSPINRASRLWPSVSVRRASLWPWITWLLVSTRPSGEMMTPEPMPPDRRPLRAASTRTTAGPTRSTKAAMPLDTASSDAIASLGSSLSCLCLSERSGVLRKIGVIRTYMGLAASFSNRPPPLRAARVARGSHHYEAGADRNRDCFDPAAGAELFRKRGHVKFHCMGRQRESARDFLVGRAFGKERQHLALPWAQVVGQFIGCLDGVSEGTRVFAAELLVRRQRITSSDDGND